MKIIAKAVGAIALLMSLAMPVSASDGTGNTPVKGKPTVLVDYFFIPKDIKYASTAAVKLREYAMESLTNTKRAWIVDIEAVDVFEIVPHIRPYDWEEYEEARHSALIDSIKPDYILTASVTNVIVDKKTYDDSVYYEAQVAYNLKVINPNNGKTILTRNFTHGNTLLGDDTGSTPEEAIENTCKQARGGLKGFFQEAFPLFGQLLSVGEVDEGRIITAYINLGEKNGVAKREIALKYAWSVNLPVVKLSNLSARLKLNS